MLCIQNDMSRKILFGLETFLPNHQGGTELYALSLARELRKRGDAIEFISPNFEENSVSYEFEGFKIRRFKVPRKVSAGQMNGRSLPGGFSSAIAEIRRASPDIFHLHSLTRSLGGVHLQAIKNMGIKTLLTPHLAGNFCVRGDLRLFGKETCDGFVRGQRCLSCYAASRGIKDQLAKPVGGIVNVAVRTPLLASTIPASLHLVAFKLKELGRVADFADAVVALSSWIETLMHTNGIVNTRVVRQAVAPEFLDKRFQRLPRKDDGILRVGYVGRVHPIKGLHWLLDSVAQLNGEKIIFHIVASSSSEDQYSQEQAAKAKKMPCVIWEENLSQAEVQKRMTNWDVLCVPSASEMAPLVILEAAACCLPVLGSNIPAVTDMVEDGVNGLLFPVGDVSALTRTFRRLAGDSSLLKQLAEGVLPPRSFAAVAEEMQEIYDSL